MNKINLKKLSDGGVRIALGTDSGGAADRFFIQGYSEHRGDGTDGPVRLDADAGYSVFLKGCLGSPRYRQGFRHLGQGQDRRPAVLEKNLLENIINMRSIQAIYLVGRKFE